MIRLLVYLTMLSVLAQGCGKAPISADNLTSSSSMPSTISTDAQ